MRFFAFCLLLFILSCKSAPELKTEEIFYQKLQGITMGVIGYDIMYKDTINYKSSLDSLMDAINNQVSTYVPNSPISKFNRSIDGIDRGEKQAEQHFIRNIEIAKRISKESLGSFDPTVMPLVNYWGFGYTPKTPISAVDTSKIDSLMVFIGMDNVSVLSDRVDKTSIGVELDFSASAKGYFIDEVGKWLEGKGILDYKVEIGGEVRTGGKNPNGDFWRLGINTPMEGARSNDLFAVIQLDHQSIATSGNYQNYYKVEDVTYSHTINPKTGFPERTNLLSASVITKDCAYADAYATACMVMGLERAKDFINSLPKVEAYFIYSDENNALQTYASEGIKQKVSRF